MPASTSLFVWLWLVVNDRKFLVKIVFFSHTNQPTVLLYETNQPTQLYEAALCRRVACQRIEDKYRNMRLWVPLFSKGMLSALVRLSGVTFFFLRGFFVWGCLKTCIIPHYRPVEPTLKTCIIPPREYSELPQAGREATPTADASQHRATCREGSIRSSLPSKITASLQQ